MQKAYDGLFSDKRNTSIRGCMRLMSRISRRSSSSVLLDTFDSNSLIRTSYSPVAPSKTVTQASLLKTLSRWRRHKRIAAAALTEFLSVVGCGWTPEKVSVGTLFLLARMRCAHFSFHHHLKCVCCWLV
jgi:hypothetical protein